MNASIFTLGAILVRDFVTEAEERRILHRIAGAEWLYDLSRRTQHYGYRYDYRGRDRGVARHVPASPFPRWVAAMAERLAPWFPQPAAQCIVNEYRPGQGIAMHADHADFGPVVASLSLGDEWPMQFRPRGVRPYVPGRRPGDEVVVLPRRSVLVLQGAARSHWMHGIHSADTRARSHTRVSATFRTLARL